jgi:hypothetical protein
MAQIGSRRAGRRSDRKNTLATNSAAAPSLEFARTRNRASFDEIKVPGWSTRQCDLTSRKNEAEDEAKGGARLGMAGGHGGALRNNFSGWFQCSASR